MSTNVPQTAAYIWFAQALKRTGIKLEKKEGKQLLDAVTWTNPDAAPVIKKVLKTKADPMYGAERRWFSVEHLVRRVRAMKFDTEARRMLRSWFARQGLRELPAEESSDHVVAAFGCALGLVLVR